MTIKPKFNTDDFVFYPGNGVCKIVGREETEVSNGFKVDCLVLRPVGTKSSTQGVHTLRVPFNKANENIKPLYTKADIEAALETILGKSEGRNRMWSKRSTLFAERLKESTPESLALILRDTKDDPSSETERSYSEIALRREAMTAFSQMAAWAMEIDTASAERMIWSKMDGNALSDATSIALTTIPEEVSAPTTTDEPAVNIQQARSAPPNYYHPDVIGSGCAPK